MDGKEAQSEPASISRGTTAREIGEFWDSHDFTDYEAECPDVTDQFEFDIQSVRHLVAVDPDLLQEAITSAHRKGIAVRSLINLALREALDRLSHR